MDKDFKEYIIKIQENILQASIDGILITDSNQNILVQFHLIQVCLKNRFRLFEHHLVCIYEDIDQ